jgi:hypothetical protein
MLGVRRHAWLGAAFGLLVTSGLTTPLPAADPGPYCGVADDFKKADEQEQRCLKRLPRMASRKGNALVLHLDGGAAKTVRSDPKACLDDNARDCVRARLVGYHERGRLFIILKNYYEGWDYSFVSAGSGAETKLGDFPHFAPDGSTFVVVDAQAEGSQDYYFAVGTVATDPPSITWRNQVAVVGEWEFQRWVDQDHVGLVVATQTRDCPVPKCEGMLTRTGKDWTFELVPARK